MNRTFFFTAVTCAFSLDAIAQDAPITAPAPAPAAAPATCTCTATATTAPATCTCTASPAPAAAPAAAPAVASTVKVENPFDQTGFSLRLGLQSGLTSNNDFTEGTSITAEYRWKHVGLYYSFRYSEIYDDRYDYEDDYAMGDERQHIVGLKFLAHFGQRTTLELAMLSAGLLQQEDRDLPIITYSPEINLEVHLTQSFALSLGAYADLWFSNKHESRWYDEGEPAAIDGNAHYGSQFGASWHF